MMIRGCLFILITFLFLTLWHSKDLKLSFCICLCHLCLYLHICSLLAQCSGWAWTKHSAIKKILRNYLLNQILNQTEENLVFGTKYLPKKQKQSFWWCWYTLISKIKQCTSWCRPWHSATFIIYIFPTLSAWCFNSPPGLPLHFGELLHSGRIIPVQSTYLNLYGN